MTHLIRLAHFTHWRHGLPSSLDCSCGETIAALPDPTLDDPHSPLATAYRRHRAEAGLSNKNSTPAYDRSDGSDPFRRDNRQRPDGSRPTRVA